MQAFRLTLCLLFFGFSLSAQNREILAEYRIAFMGQDIENPIYEAAFKGAQLAARELEREYSIQIELMMRTPMVTEGVTQTAVLSELQHERLDGLIISPAEDASIRDAIGAALEIEDAVVFFENQLPEAVPLLSVLADETEAGRMAGREILKHLPTGGRVSILTRTKPTEELRQRLKGVREVLGFRRIESVVHCDPNYRAAIERLHQAEEADRNGLIDAWIFLEDWPLRGMPALPWQPGAKPLVALQSSPSAFLYMEQGYLKALVVHPYFDWGYTGMEALIKKIHDKQSPEVNSIYFEPGIINLRGQREYQDSWREWLR